LRGVAIMKVKLLQFGDLHMDAPFTSLSGVEGGPSRRRQELKQALARLMDLAEREKPDMVLVCGDLYEHGYTGKSSIYYICDQFRRIPEIPVLIIPGNHDPKLPGSYYSDHSWPSNVHILGNGDIFEAVGTGAKVYGGMDGGPVDPAFINILMHHGTLDMQFSPDAFGPISGKHAEALGFDYCALGHFHSRIMGAGAGGIFYNAGSPEPLGFDEEGEHGAILAVIEKEPGGKAVINADFISICTRRFINLTVDVTGCCTNEQAEAFIAGEMENAGRKCDLFRIRLQGRIPAGVVIDTAQVVQDLADRAFLLRIIDDTVPDYDLSEISREKSLRGLFVRKMLERASRSDDETNGLVMQALFYGLEAIDEGKVCI